MLTLYQSPHCLANGNSLGREKKVISKCQLRNTSMDKQRRLNFYPLKIMIPDKKSKNTKKFLGKGLGVSLLMDPSTRYWSENTQPALLPPELPSEGQLERTIIEFMQFLTVTMQQAREIECETRSQCHCPKWFAARRYRITASNFELIYRRKPDTAPDATLLDQRQITVLDLTL